MRNVLLNIETTNHFGRDIVQGIMTFAFQYRWNLAFEHHSLLEVSLTSLADWKGTALFPAAEVWRLPIKWRKRDCRLECAAVSISRSIFVTFFAERPASRRRNSGVKSGSSAASSTSRNLCLRTLGRINRQQKFGIVNQAIDRRLSRKFFTFRKNNRHALTPFVHQFVPMPRERYRTPCQQTRQQFVPRRLT